MTQEKDDFDHLAAEVRQRPAYHAAGVFLRRMGVTRGQHPQITVGELGLLIELTFGAKLSGDAVALALRDAGHSFAMRNMVGIGEHRELVVNARLPRHMRTPWQSEVPNRQRFAKWGDA